ncbi:MAG TPA: oxygenase MpaB family protein [Candidatus Limnocylindria bacterium]|nr:oxygenase MpaB family protein [Candidatus Limnocylindria bacterium]
MVVQAAERDRRRIGLFGPESMAWRIDREVLILAGGTCALLMQLAHPAVAAGVEQHSDFRADPFARLQRTLTASFDVVFGTTARAERAIRRMNAIHGAVRGSIPESGAGYFARDPRLLLWVQATLVDTALRIYDAYVSPLADAQAEAYHAESRRVAVRLGVPEDLMPVSLVELRAEMASMIASGEVHVSPTARSLASSVMYPTAFPPRFVWDAAHLVSMSVMPAPLRQQYAVPWSAARERAMRRVAWASRSVLPFVPAPLRFVPQYRSALRRAGAATNSRRVRAG